MLYIRDKSLNSIEHCRLLINEIYWIVLTSLFRHRRVVASSYLCDLAQAFKSFLNVFLGHRPMKTLLKHIPLLIIGSFAISNVVASETFVCNTSEHTVFVNSAHSNEFHYTAWNKPKSITEEPDVLVVGGEEITEGTGVCRTTRWEFNNSNIQYIIRTPVACAENIPPPNATGRLSVFINDKHIKSWWCLE
ncbi:MAG: hypothetical protein XD36_0971 [Halomonas sp. 54_146]|nr:MULTISPECIES: hypothetical protein [unclassified Halomonas]KUJ88523.1 MAG: hypothetical protein XD36_0971 [Halomonas sp. 54_146]HAA45762.1 hypothetical protein [Halomonas sp.]